MTIEKLATMTQREFFAVRKEMSDGFSEVRKEMSDGFSEVRKEMSDGFSEVRKEMSDGFTEFRREIVGEVRDIVRDGAVKTIASNEKVASKLDDFLKDRAAHDSLHKRITDDLHRHDQRIKKLEARV